MEHSEKNQSINAQALSLETIEESLRDWFKKEKWVRISTSGNIAGPCGTSKNKKNPDRCLPKAKAQSLSKAERAATARKKKKAGKKGKTVVANTKKAKVTREMKEQWPQGTQSRYQEFSFKLVKVMPDRAKYLVTDIETGEVKGTIVFNTVDQLHDYASDLIKPLGGTQSTHLGERKVTREDIQNLVVGLIHEIQNENTIMEKDDRCTRLAKQKYDTWPSAYASGAVVRCRRGEIWKNEDVGISSRGTGSVEKELEKAMQQVGQQIATAAKNVKPSNDDKPEDVNEVGVTLALTAIAGAPGLIELLGKAVNFIGKVLGKKDGTEVGNWLTKIGHKFENFYIASIGGWIKAAFPQKFKDQDPNDVSSSLHDYAHGIYLGILGALAIASGIEAYKAAKLAVTATEGSLGVIKIAEVAKLSKEIAKHGVKL